MREGAEVALTPQEFKIVKFMTQNPNRVDVARRIVE